MEKSGKSLTVKFKITLEICTTITLSFLCVFMNFDNYVQQFSFVIVLH